MRTHSDVLWLRPSYQSGILAEITATIIDQGYAIPALAARAGIPALKVQQIVRSRVAQREMASLECFLQTQGARVSMTIDGRSRRVRLASIPADYRAQAAVNIALTRRQAYLRSAPGTPADADARARQSLEAYQGKLHEDLAHELRPAPPVAATSLVQIAHQLLCARQQVAQLRWTDQALMLSAGMLQAKMRAAVIKGRPVPLLAMIDALVATLRMSLSVEVGTLRRWTLGTAGALPTSATIPQHTRAMPSGPRAELGSSVLVPAVLERLADRGLTVGDVARSARVPETTLARWQRAGTDRALAQLESLLTALGCRIALCSPGRARRLLPRIALPPQRLRPARTDVASILRAGVAQQTGLAGAALERCVRRRITQRLRLLRRAAAAPLVQPDGTALPRGQVIGDRLHDALIAVLERRRRMDQERGLRWPVIDLVLLSGVPRQAITSLLAATSPHPSEATLQKVLRTLSVQLEVLPPPR